MFFDPNYLLFVMLPAMILSGIAQLFVRSAFSKWGNVRNGGDLSGVDVADRIKRSAGLSSVVLEPAPEGSGDHYDPRSHTVRVTRDVAASPSVKSMAIVAHELGHAQQHAEKSALIQMRGFLLPAVQFSPMLAYGLIFAGVIFNIAGLAWLGVLFFGVVVLFMVLTLPVEIDASRRGLKLLETSGLMLTAEDRSGARQVLTAAALTYVAAAITALLQLFYYISLVSRSSRR